MCVRSDKSDKSSFTMPRSASCCTRRSAETVLPDPDSPLIMMHCNQQLIISDARSEIRIKNNRFSLFISNRKFDFACLHNTDKYYINFTLLFFLGFLTLASIRLIRLHYLGMCAVNSAWPSLVDMRNQCQRKLGSKSFLPLGLLVDCFVCQQAPTQNFMYISSSSQLSSHPHLLILSSTPTSNLTIFHKSVLPLFYLPLFD